MRDYFEIGPRGSSVRGEVIAGATTFLTMSYILFVNPAILSEAGMDRDAVFVATCAAAAVGSLIMGLVANYPIAIAPGMGLNAFFTYGVVIGMGVAWQTALGAVFVSGLLFVALSLSPIRAWIINAIPKDLKLSIASGIGLFLIIIGLTNAGVVVDNPATLVGLGDLGSAPVLLAALCFLAIGVLESLRVPGAILLAMLGVTVLGAALGVSEVAGVVSAPPDPSPTLFALDVAGALDVALIAVILSFLFVDMFDTAGTLVGVAHRAGFLDADGRIPRLRRALLADSLATVTGAAAGTSSATSYVESVAGVRAGGRTGLTAVVVAGLFAASLFFAPLAGSIQAYATGPALVYVGCVMVGGLAAIDWEDATSFVPAVVTAVAMPLTYSIATGIGFGFITFAALKLATGRFGEAGWAVMALAGLFVAKFAFLGG
ncbi:MAG: NCS2 family permease [Caulobacterales bacterium]|nr:NCS2 family permease [Caulobacterales bacterium]